MNKTNKSILKRVKITGNKNILRRKMKQNHFNSKETGQKTGDKRSIITMITTKGMRQSIFRYL